VAGASALFQIEYSLKSSRSQTTIGHRSIHFFHAAAADYPTHQKQEKPHES
jgi:hypothetical protein